MKFDITKVPGYAAEMSAEDKLKLIEGFEIDLSGYVLKSVSDKNASEAAEYKKKYNATLTEQERREAELAEINKQRDAELAQLKRERAIDQQTAKYISLGFDAELATATAIARTAIDPTWRADPCFAWMQTSPMRISGRTGR